MLRMEEIQAAMDLIKTRSRERLDGGKERLERSEGKEQVLKWFVETQASLVLCDGSFPTWFCGFISRQEAEDQLRDKTLGRFLIRLSEKASGYILSYKGQDRCRHFVINQTKEDMLVVTGDSVSHKSLPELIEYFTVTPIQPFGECLILEKEAESPSDELYDVVNCKATVKSGVSVQALRSLWDQRSDVTAKAPPALPPKSGNRKLICSTSIDRNSIIQTMPPVQKKNLPLRNSLSGGHLLHGLEQHGQSEQKWSNSMEASEGLHQRRKMCIWENESFTSLDSHLECYTEHSGHFSRSDGLANSHQSSRSRSLPHLDEDYSQLTYPSLPEPTHEHPAPPFTSSAVVFNEQNQPGLRDTNLIALETNPLYQTSSGLSAGRNSYWPPHGDLQTRLSSQDPLTLENTYQDIPEHQHNNTYEDVPAIHQRRLATQENNTYEDLPEFQQRNPPNQELNTYEDLPANTYASVEELQTIQQSSLGKKAHKWWKFKPESKKK